MSLTRFLRRVPVVAFGALVLAGIVHLSWWSFAINPPVCGSYAGEAWRGNSLAMTFRWCPPGNFLMGSPGTEVGRKDDEQQVAVTLSHGFWLGQTEVTQREWQAVMKTMPWKGEDYVHEGADYPAVLVSHEDACRFCEKLTIACRAAGRLPSEWEYRLPTEAEWEYGCRAGTSTRYSFGDDAAKLGKYAWFVENSKGEASNAGTWLVEDELYAHRVATKVANAWGLYDMSGNISEWCLDGYSARLPGGIDPKGSPRSSRRVIRDGFWGLGEWSFRSACRNSEDPKDRANIVGFRVALVQRPHQK